MRLRLLPLALALLAAVPAAAQQRTAALETAPRARLLPGDTVPDTAAVKWSQSWGERLTARTVAGSFGWALGALVGAAAGFAVGEGGGEWEGLDEAAVLGMAGGAVVGAAGAALPPSPRGCAYGARFRRGLVGSLAGTFVGLAVASSVDDDAWLLAVPLGGGVGAAVAADC